MFLKFTETTGSIFESLLWLVIGLIPQTSVIYMCFYSIRYIDFTLVKVV